MLHPDGIIRFALQSPYPPCHSVPSSIRSNPGPYRFRPVHHCPCRAQYIACAIPTQSSGTYRVIQALFRRGRCGRDDNDVVACQVSGCGRVKGRCGRHCWDSIVWVCWLGQVLVDVAEKRGKDEGSVGSGIGYEGWFGVEGVKRSCLSDLHPGPTGLMPPRHEWPVMLKYTHLYLRCPYAPPRSPDPPQVIPSHLSADPCQSTPSPRSSPLDLRMSSWRILCPIPTSKPHPHYPSPCFAYWHRPASYLHCSYLEHPVQP